VSVGLSKVDEQQIEDVLHRMVTTWNDHDMDAFGELLWDDTVALNYIGSLARNREEFSAALRFMHTNVYEKSVLTASTDLIRAVAPGVVVAVVRNDLTPDPSDRGATLRGRWITVLVQRDDEWRIASFQNTKLQEDVN
jgi:uncharacterized protein (TIGR02246 family)